MSTEATTEAERCLLAGVLLDPSTIDDAIQIVAGSQFHCRELGQVFDHVQDLHAAGTRISDLTVLITELRKASLIESIGGAAGVAKLLGETPHSANVTYHAGEVVRFHRLRRLRLMAAEITNATEDAQADPTAIAAKFECTSSAMSASDSRGVVSLSGILEELAELMDAHREHDTTIGVGTGLSSVDLMTGGMMPGELIVIGARTSIGKTAFGMQVALDAAVSEQPTLVISLEMSEHQLAQRIVASQLGLSLVDQRTGSHSPADSQRVRDYASECSGVPLSLFPARRSTMAQIRGIARAQKRRSGLALVLVDYLQLVSPRDPRRPRYEQVTEISNDLKTLAMELDVVVVALAQLNRQGEANEAPKLSHLRESGAIEQDADSVWFLHRARNSAETELIIEKQRQGKRGTLDLTFDGARCRFDEPAIEDHPNYNPDLKDF